MMTMIEQHAHDITVGQQCGLFTLPGAVGHVISSQAADSK